MRLDWAAGGWPIPICFSPGPHSIKPTLASMVPPISSLLLALGGTVDVVGITTADTLGIVVVDTVL